MNVVGHDGRLSVAVLVVDGDYDLRRTIVLLAIF